MKPYQIKVNVSGSWANLVSVAPKRLGEVKAACEQLAVAHLGPIAFKVIDTDRGLTIEQFSNPPKAGEPYGWYQPRKPIDNPIQAGIDRTTSGAIGQP